MRMDSKGICRPGIVAGLWMVLTLGISPASAADISGMIRETQQSRISGGVITTVWWVPQQFWEESLRSNPAVPPAMSAQVLDVLDDYVIVSMLRATSGAQGYTDVQSLEQLLKNARVEVNGKPVEPLAPYTLPAAAQLILAQLKPAMATMAGQAGAAMQFVMYPARNADGKPLVDVLQTGNLKITLFDQTFNFRLPLGSLLPPRIDKKTGEEFSGNYKFNPFTGDKLTTR